MDQNCLLYYYYAYENSQVKIKISDADFTWLNPNDILVVAAHLKESQTLELSTRAFNPTINYLKDYVAKFGRSNVDFTHLFNTYTILASFSIEIEGVNLLDEGPMKELDQGFVYLKKSIGKKEFFRV